MPLESETAKALIPYQVVTDTYDYYEVRNYVNDINQAHRGVVKGGIKMDLNINSPSYYTQEYGVDDDIYWMCRELSEALKQKKYSDVIDIIGIVPIIAPVSVIQKGLCKEHKKCEIKYGFASVSLQIDYEEYVKSDISTKKRLIVDNILKSVKTISKKGKIDYGLFENDVKIFCENNSIII